MERSGTSALGVRHPVSAAVPRCKAPSERGLSAQPTGGEKNRMTSLPPSALRADTSLAEGGKRERIPTQVCIPRALASRRGLARNDRERADRVVRPYDVRQGAVRNGTAGTSYPKGICSAALHGRTPSPANKRTAPRRGAVLVYEGVTTPGSFPSPC